MHGKRSGAPAAETHPDVLRALQNPELLSAEPKAATPRRGSDRSSALARLWSGTMNFLSSDIRSAARSLMRAPTFTVSGVLCLALGIGVTAAIASAIDRALLQPLPFRDPQRLVTIYRVSPHVGANSWPFSPANYKDLAASSHRVESMAAIASGGALVALHDETVRVSPLARDGKFLRHPGRARARWPPVYIS